MAQYRIKNFKFQDIPLLDRIAYRRKVVDQQFMYGIVFHYNPDPILTKPQLKSAGSKLTDLKRKSF